MGFLAFLPSVVDLGVISRLDFLLLDVLSEELSLLADLCGVGDLLLQELVEVARGECRRVGFGLECALLVFLLLQLFLNLFALQFFVFLLPHQLVTDIFLPLLQLPDSGFLLVLGFLNVVVQIHEDLAMG